mmetsp:Transcript_81986/g.232420  ORF Transcript_81986/g.232420 Transcript_81986/m.232420 type:complete len:241 (+) Transcript_81986:70-792(+)
MPSLHMFNPRGHLRGQASVSVQRTRHLDLLACVNHKLTQAHGFAVNQHVGLVAVLPWVFGELGGVQLDPAVAPHLLDNHRLAFPLDAQGIAVLPSQRAEVDVGVVHHLEDTPPQKGVLLDGHEEVPANPGRPAVDEDPRVSPLMLCPQPPVPVDELAAPLHNVPPLLRGDLVLARLRRVCFRHDPDHRLHHQPLLAGRLQVRGLRARGSAVRQLAVLEGPWRSACRQCGDTAVPLSKRAE